MLPIRDTITTNHHRFATTQIWYFDREAPIDAPTGRESLLDAQMGIWLFIFFQPKTGRFMAWAVKLARPQLSFIKVCPVADGGEAVILSKQDGANR